MSNSTEDTYMGGEVIAAIITLLLVNVGFISCIIFKTSIIFPIAALYLGGFTIFGIIKFKELTGDIEDIKEYTDPNKFTVKDKMQLADYCTKEYLSRTFNLPVSLNWECNSYSDYANGIRIYTDYKAPIYAIKTIIRSKALNLDVSFWYSLDVDVKYDVFVENLTSVITKMVVNLRKVIDEEEKIMLEDNKVVPKISWGEAEINAFEAYNDWLEKSNKKAREINKQTNEVKMWNMCM